MTENQHTEWKEAWRDEYLKWLCGFANAEGGVLVLGRDDKGSPVGLSDAKKLLAQVQQAKWNREQDIYLIEHNHLPLAELMQQLCFNEEEIMARRKLLGLTTRLKQMRKLSH